MARNEQRPPEGNWRTWLYLAGRGAGKTRSGAEWACDQVAAGYSRLALVAPTASDVRDVVVEGESGILAVARRLGIRVNYEPSKRRLTWPNGAIATTYTADEPDRLRGPQHDAAWCDEIAAWRYPEAWDMLMFGLRLGLDPRVAVTTTPRPVKLLKELLKREGQDVVVTRGTTYDNLANLAPAFAEQIITRYEGTRLGRQELNAEVLEDVEGALWNLAEIDAARVQESEECQRIIIGVDPAVSSGPDSDETGILIAGLGTDGHGYIIADRSGRFTPMAWAERVCLAYDEYEADAVVGEVNNGGDLVRANLVAYCRSKGRAMPPFKAVRASRGKFLRADPIATLYEQGRIHHVGTFIGLEDEMTQFLPEGGNEHDDRVDALVWAMTELMVVPEHRRLVVA